MASASRLLFAACLLLLTAGPVVLAQSDGSSVYLPGRAGTGGRNPLEWLFGRSRPAAQPADQGRAKAYQPRRRGAEARKTAPGQAGPDLIGPPDPNAPKPETTMPAVQSADGTPAPVVPPAPAQPPVTVAIIGDSLSVFLAQGLQEIYAERPAVSFLKRSREASGLVREDYHDWPKALRELVAATPRPDAVVMMIGSNDRQQLRDESGVHEPKSERWRALYAKRIDTLIEIARDKSVPLIWVGLPTMRAERYSADLVAFNDLYRARAQAMGASFVDVWEAFAGDDGAYVTNGPDVDGEMVRLRTSDGVHFTKAGARKLGFFADKELQKIVAAVQAHGAEPARLVTPEPAAPGEPATGVQPPAAIVIAPQPRSIDQMLGIALPDQPLQSDLAPRPAQGAVIALTAPPLASGGQLIGPGRVNAAAPLVFTQGRSAPAKPGRADDFRMDPY